MARYPLSASRFVREILELPGFELFNDIPASNKILSIDEIQSTDVVGYMRVPNRPRPLQILADEGKSWLSFRYFRRTRRVASAMLIADVARTLNSIALYRESES
jgi:hypothetical protein